MSEIRMHSEDSARVAAHVLKNDGAYAYESDAWRENLDEAAAWICGIEHVCDDDEIEILGMMREAIVTIPQYEDATGHYDPDGLELMAVYAVFSETSDDEGRVMGDMARFKSRTLAEQAYETQAGNDELTHVALHRAMVPHTWMDDEISEYLDEMHDGSGPGQLLKECWPFDEAQERIIEDEMRSNAQPDAEWLEHARQDELDALDAMQEGK